VMLLFVWLLANIRRKTHHIVIAHARTCSLLGIPRALERPQLTGNRTILL
jgi:hypothetical protein